MDLAGPVPAAVVAAVSRGVAAEAAVVMAGQAAALARDIPVDRIAPAAAGPDRPDIVG